MENSNHRASALRLARCKWSMFVLLLFFGSLPSCSSTGDQDAPGDTTAYSLEEDTKRDATGPPEEMSESEGELVINEVVPRPEGGGQDWLELLVVGNTPVNLSDFTLVDDSKNHSPADLPDVLLEPGAFYVIKAISEEDSSEEPSVPFKLGGDDALTLARDGAIVDNVVWLEGDAPRGTSYGRLPDGTGKFQVLKPTPGAPNEAMTSQDEPCTDPFVTNQVLSVELELSPEAWSAIKSDPQAEEYQQGNFIFEGVVVEDVGIRVKGNSSLNSVTKQSSERFPFKVDFNRYVDGQEFCGLKKLVLNNGFKDPTLIREHLAYKLAREVGLPASRTAFVDLTVSGQHLGLYTMVEPVDDDFFLEANFGNDDGDLYKPDWTSGNLMWRGTNIEDYDGLSIENNEDTTDHSAFLSLVNIINNGPADDVDKVLDVDTMLKYAAFNTVLVNLDSYTGSGHNYYLYEQEGVFTVIPWDLNEAFGNFSCGCDYQGLVDFLVDEPTCGKISDRPMLYTPFLSPASVSQYHEHLKSFLEGPFSEENMAAWITEAADLIRPYVYNDPTKFYSNEAFETALTSQTPHRSRASSPSLLPFVIARATSIAKQLEERSPSTNNGQGNCGQGGGGGKPPGNNPKCPDGVCDAFEQANPEVCPEDCE